MGSSVPILLNPMVGSGSPALLVPDDDEGETTTNGVESKRVGLGWDGKGTGGV